MANEYPKAVIPLDEEAGVMADNKMLHVMYRVANLDTSTKFYRDVLGMKVLRRRNVPEKKFSNAFVGYGMEVKGEYFSIELTQKEGVDSYEHGDGFRYVSIRHADMDRVISRAKEAGAKIVYGPTDVELGPSIVPDEPAVPIVQTTMRLLDPDGYTVEVVSGERRDPLAMVSVNVVDLDRSIKFYVEALGMTLLRKRSMVPTEPCIRAYLGYGKEDDNPMLELNHPYTIEPKLSMGDGYGQIALSTPDVFTAAAHIRNVGYKITREPGPIKGIETKITGVHDPDNYRVILVDAQDFENELKEQEIGAAF